MEVPNNNPNYTAITPAPDSQGQTFHKQNFETDGITNFLNVNNNPSGVWSGSNGGFGFATLNSTLSSPLPLLNLTSNGAEINTQIYNTAGNTNLDLTNHALTLINGTTTGFFNGYYFRITDNSQTYNIQSQITPANMVLSNQNIDAYLNVSPNEMLLAGYTDPKSNRINNSGFTIDSPTSQTAVNFYRVLLTDTSESNSSSIKIQPANGFLQYNSLSAVGKINSNINFYNINNAPSIVLDDNTSTNTITKNTITLNDSVHNSELTTSDLLFNGVSYSVNLTKSFNQYISAAIYADGRPPTTPSSTITQTYAFTPAWYFKNSVAGYKINWYIGPDVGMTVSKVLGIYMNIFNASTTSNDNTPFLTIYTQPQSGDSTFYHSKRTYVFNQAITPTVNTRYNMFMNVAGNCPTPSIYGSTLNNMELTSVGGGSVGPFAPTELILAFTIGTNSASAVNSVEFAINKFGIMTPTGTTEVNFIPST